MNLKHEKILKILAKIICTIIIAAYASALTPKTLQNDTFYTVKIGETISNTTEHYYNLLPWNKGLDMVDHFSFHNIPYTYPHWLYDVISYKIYSVWNFNGIYVATCALAIILGLSIYFINLKLNKSNLVSFIMTIGSLFCLRGFIAARAQLVTFILFALTIYGIEKFLETKKVRYGIGLVLISLLIANLHCAVWPFYFILYLPYVAEYICAKIVTADYAVIVQNIRLFFKTKLKKITGLQLSIEKNKIQKMKKKHSEKVEEAINKSYKIELVRANNVKWLIGIAIVCALMGLFTPIKFTPYTYLVNTMKGNTTRNISEHLPLVLIENKEMIFILAITFGIFIFSKTRIKLRELFMIVGLIGLSFMSQRQVSMLVLVGNFIIARFICEIIKNVKEYINRKSADGRRFELFVADMLGTLFSVVIIGTLSFCFFLNKKNSKFVDSYQYPVEAAKFINENIIPEIGVENLRLYNEYNYGSYLLYSGIPVFIDSRADLYTPEFSKRKDSNGNLIYNDIFSDFLNISNLNVEYENKFKEYKITHVIAYSSSKLSNELSSNDNYKLLYHDSRFVVYERENVDE